MSHDVWGIDTVKDTGDALVCFWSAGIPDLF